jgi:arsenite methyltransferase
VISNVNKLFPPPLRRYYGCGLVFPTAVEGMNVLDFGSGAGRDCFILSKLVGKDGFVTGVDMTEEQVRRY